MTSPLLQAIDVHIHFDGLIAADGVTLDVFPEEFLAIVGPNGAGKTTFLNICTGYLKPDQGTVIFAGEDISRKTPRERTQLGIARSFQHPQLFIEQDLMTNILLSIGARDGFWNPLRRLDRPAAVDEAHALLNLFQIDQHADAIIHNLPEGVRKLADIALALALKPRLLMMDEPTSGVSATEKTQVMDILINALQEQSVAAVFIEHDMDVVTRYAHRVAVWNQGKIQICDTPDVVMNDADVRANVIGME